jgi:hypothetical protein
LHSVQEKGGGALRFDFLRFVADTKALNRCTPSDALSFAFSRCILRLKFLLRFFPLAMLEGLIAILKTDAGSKLYLMQGEPNRINANQSGGCHDPRGGLGRPGFSEDLFCQSTSKSSFKMSAQDFPDGRESPGISFLKQA